MKFFPKGQNKLLTDGSRYINIINAMLRDSVMVALLTLDQPVRVQILLPQPKAKNPEMLEKSSVSGFCFSLLNGEYPLLQMRIYALLTVPVVKKWLKISLFLGAFF